MQVSIDELRSTYDKLVSNQQAQAFYEKLPRNVWWDTSNLQCSTTIIRESADTDELIHRMQITDLFGTNTDTDLKAAAVDWLLRKYASCGLHMDSLPPAIEESPHSEPNISVNRNGRRLSVDFLLTVSGAWDIRQYLQKSLPPFNVVELGGGLGHLARTLRLFGISKSHLILDLPETLIFSYAFLSTNFPDVPVLFITDEAQAAKVRPAQYGFVFVPSCFAESLDLAASDLFVNTASLGEMQNETIRYWMDFVQRRLPVEYLFTQNRFLNTIDPRAHAWRWDENECSVHYDSSWTILKWDLEPRWHQCPYVVPSCSRCVEIIATRETAQDPAVLAEHGRKLLEEVKLEDWFHVPNHPEYMSLRQNRFKPDVTMTGALFKLWESIRLCPTAESVFVLLRYLDTLLHDPATVFEETRYYEQLFLKLLESEPEQRPGLVEYAAALRAKSPVDPIPLVFELIGETRDYNIVAARRPKTATPDSDPKRYYAIAKLLGPLDLFQERLGERELPNSILFADTFEAAVEKARQHDRPLVHLDSSMDGYNIVKTTSGYLAIAQSLGPVSPLQERLGEKELAPVILKADTSEELRDRIAKARNVDRPVRWFRRGR